MQTEERDNTMEKPNNLALIVAIGDDGAIGRDNDLLWQLPGDLPRFKKLTTGHTVIMGRRTWESLRRKPLPGRRNVVLSRDLDFHPEGAEVFTSLDDALTATAGEELPFVIGGGQIYRRVLPLVSHLFLTEVHCATPDADTFLKLDEKGDFKCVYREDIDAQEMTPAFSFCDYIRKSSKS